MLKLLLIKFMLIISFQVYSQSSFDGLEEYTPFNPVDEFNTKSIKAKVLLFPIGNGFYCFNSLGFELGFLKNNSINIDGFYNFGRDTRDDETDKYGVKQTTGNKSKGYEKSVQFSYRYYYGFKKFRGNYRKAFYNGVFYRFGKEYKTKDENFKNDYINKNTNNNCYGIVIGMISRFKNSEHFGIDYHLYIGQQNNEVTTIYQNYETIVLKSTTGYYNIGVSINYWF